MLTCIETKKNLNTSTFLIEPLEIGQGITLGNSLRRNLLSDIPGQAVTGVKFNSFGYPFKNLSGVHEEIIEILLNLKQLVFKDSFLFDVVNQNQKGFFYLKGPSIITGKNFKLPNTGLQIINKNNYICTILNNSSLFCEIDITKGRGYQLSSENTSSLSLNSFIKIDAVFTPVTKVNFKIRIINDSFGNLRDSLVLDIQTNGSVSPKRVLKESLKNILTLMTNLFVISDLKSLI